MKQNSSIPHIVVGAVLFIMGGYLAWSFYNFNTGIITTTQWKEVIIFSVISVLGLLIFVYGTRKNIKTKKQ